MAGHSKWANIKHTKSVQDARKSARFTKIARKITIATKEGGSGDPELNFRLRIALEDAKNANVPKENISRAIAKGLGNLNGVQLESLTYEIVGLRGAGIIVEAISDNRNRLLQELKSILKDFPSWTLGGGGIAWQFQRVSEITISKALTDDSAILFLDYGFISYKNLDEKTSLILCEVPQRTLLEKQLSIAGIKILESRLGWSPKMTVSVMNDEKNELCTLIELLEENDDVSGVWHNMI
jgi:YebC/PmpR family DNA-binding regulatory protein